MRTRSFDRHAVARGVARRARILAAVNGVDIGAQIGDRQMIALRRIPYIRNTAVDFARRSPVVMRHRVRRS